MKILITGSQGNIGRWTVKTLLEAGHEVKTLDYAAQPRDNAWEHFPGDILDLSLVRKAVEGSDAVVHLAALMADVRGQENQMLSVNVQGTWNVLIACVEAGASRVVYFSSLQALGHNSPHHTALYLPLDDDVPRQPATTYQISKHVAEEICQAYSVQHGLTIASMRPTYVFQPELAEDPWWRDLPDEVRARSSTRDYWSFVDVRDVAQAVLLALDAPLRGHQAFLLSSDFTTARLPTLDLVKKYYPHFAWPKITPEEYTQNNPYRGLIDCAHAKQVLGWQPRWSRREEILGEG